MPKPISPDFSVRYCGTVSQLFPLTKAAREFIEAFVDYEPYQRMGSSLVIESRYIGPLIEGMLEDGLIQA